VRIRDARAEEFDRIGELRVAAYRADGFLSDASRYADTLRVLGMDGGGEILAAVDDEGILGTYRPRPPVAKDSSRLLRPRQRGGVGERAAWEFPCPQHQAAAVSTFLAPGLRFFYDGQRRAPGSECRLISVAARSIRRTRRSLRFMSFCWRY
jgi:hypothetical protein